MKDLHRIFGERRTLLFFDLEATQVSHELIEIGAFRVTLNEDLSIKKVFKPYHAYVKPKHRIGAVVTKLTGIDEKLIERKGISYREVLTGLQKYLGKEFNRTLLVCYGDQDPRILQASSENNMDASREMSRYLSRHCFNFEVYLGNFFRDDNGNFLSLSNICNRMGLEFEGVAHGATADAKNLLNLYVAFLEKPELTIEGYKHVLTATHSIPAPLREVAKRLLNGQTVTPEEYDYIVKESLKWAR